MEQQKEEQEWDIRKHAVKRFRERFLRRKKKSSPKKRLGKRYSDEEVRKIMNFYLNNAKIFAKEVNTNNPVTILLANSEYGNIYFIVRGTVVYTVYPKNFIRRKLKQGVWQRIKS